MNNSMMNHAAKNPVFILILGQYNTRYLFSGILTFRSIIMSHSGIFNSLKCHYQYMNLKSLFRITSTSSTLTWKISKLSLLIKFHYILNKDYNSLLIYIMESHNKNSNLWNKILIIVTMVPFFLDRSYVFHACLQSSLTCG